MKQYICMYTIWGYYMILKIILSNFIHFNDFVVTILQLYVNFQATFKLFRNSEILDS
jgi:hypothetical protein